MTNGTSQGLFIVVAIVIFGIFVGMSYVVFGSEGLTNDLENLFTDSTDKATSNLIKNRKLVYSSNNEIDRFNDVYGSEDEFMQYGVDLSPIINEHGLGNYIFEFEIKATKEGYVTMYSQNGSTSEFGWEHTGSYVTTNYKQESKSVKILRNSTDTSKKSMLAFYGTYGTGVYSTVKNMRIYKVLD